MIRLFNKKKVFLFSLLVVILMTTPLIPVIAVCAQEGMVASEGYTTVEEANEYITQREDQASTLNEEIEDAKLYITRETVPMYATFWALVPPIIAIILALITKEVYLSLFVGIVSGALFYSNFHPVKTVENLFQSGMINKITDSWNVGILIFLVVLGIMVSLMNKVGGSAAYGRWASTKIKSRRGAIISTFGLGVVIFIDDYFNCLTVGSVMRPVTDKFKISRAKLAYLIDATAAPVCIIAPVSSWAAAVTSVVDGEDGIDMFTRAIPYNFYAILTLVMIISMALMKFDFGKMAVHEENALKGDLYTTAARPYAEEENSKENDKGKVIDLVLPVLVLVASCVLGMIYTGGFFDGGVSIKDAFANSNASLGLVYGSFLALVITFLIFIPRRVITFQGFADAIPEGFRSMVPAILILVFAWTLSGMTSLLGANVYVKELVEGSAESFQIFLPAIIFLIALGLAFATGTSWGTFGILLPIIYGILDPGSEMLIIAVSACLAGAVCGDHVSPISDTTIMASTGAKSDHINHVSTQLPYAMVVAGVSLVSYILAALIQNAWITLAISIVLLISILFLIKKFAKSTKLMVE